MIKFQTMASNWNLKPDLIHPLDIIVEDFTGYIWLNDIPDKTCYAFDHFGRLIVIHNHQAFFQRYSDNIYSWRWANVPSDGRIVGGMWQVAESDDDTEMVSHALTAIAAAA